LEFGGDFATTLEDLAPDAPRSPLEHGARLRNVLDQSQVFLNQKARKQISNLIHAVYMAAKMELADADAPDLRLRDPKLYESIRASAEGCVDVLFKELGFPTP